MDLMVVFSFIFTIIVIVIVIIIIIIVKKNNDNKKAVILSTKESVPSTPKSTMTFAEAIAKQENDNVLADKVVKEKCDAEIAEYVTTNPGSSWENYIKWGIAEGQTWSGPGCPALYPGQEQASKNAKLAADKVIADKVIAGKVIADKVIADKVIADKVIADKVIADKVIADKVIADKVIADKLVADAAKLAADKLLIKQKCDAETAFYVTTNPGSSWENYIKWGVSEGQTWSGPGCPALYPGQEQAAKNVKLASDKLIVDKFAADQVTCNNEKSVYKLVYPWITTDAWEHYINHGQFEERPWSGPGCGSVYPTAVQGAKNTYQQQCNEEKAKYKLENSWLTTDSWIHYINYGQFEGRPWSGPGCGTVYPFAVQSGIDAKRAADRAQEIINKAAKSTTPVGDYNPITSAGPAAQNKRETAPTNVINNLDPNTPITGYAE
jgi:hypothetical protein